jgi:prefoldin subunit 5
VNDIKKLKKVVDSLEEQSAQVSEFSGVLGAINVAKEEVGSAKDILKDLASEQKALVSESYGRFDEYGVRLTKLESQLAELERNQEKTLKNISKLSFVTPEQFEIGHDKTLLSLSELDFLTPEQHEHGCKTTERLIEDLLVEQEGRLNIVLSTHEKVLRSLRAILIVGFLGIVCAVALFGIK